MTCANAVRRRNRNPEKPLDKCNCTCYTEAMMKHRTPTEVTLQEAADRLGIDPATAWRWAQQGKLKITMHRPKSAPRIMVSEASVATLERKAQEAAQ